jgi:hypothetical protein
MTYREFISKIDRQLENMTNQEKADWIHNIARKQKEHQRNDFLMSLSCISQLEHSDDVQLDFVKQVKKIDNFIKNVENGNLYFDAEEVEYYEEDHWERDFETRYQDDLEIGKQLTAGFELAESLVMNKQYQLAAGLYERLLQISVEVIGDQVDYDPLDLSDMIDEELIRVNTKDIALHLLYSNYHILDGKDRAKRFVDYFRWKIFNGIKISELFSTGPDELDKIEYFLEEWIAALSETKTNRAMELLTEACLEAGGIDRLYKEAKKLQTQHPGLYEKVCALYKEAGDFEVCEKVGLEALQAIPQKLTVRSRVADHVLIASRENGNIEVQNQAILEAFYSRSSLNNFLRLFDLPDYKKVTEEAARIAETPTADKSNPIMRSEWRTYEMKRTGTYDQWEENAIEQLDKAVIKFFNMEFMNVVTICNNEKGFLGWSSGDIRGVVVPLFLLAMNKKDTFSKAAEALLKDIAYRLDFEESGDMGFDNCFLMWKEKISFTESEYDDISRWLNEMVQKRTEAVVGGTYRYSYHKAAKLIVAYGEMLESNGEIGAKDKEILHYKKLHSRKRAFRAELDELA